MVGLIALGNTISCFRGHEFLADKLYTGQPDLGILLKQFIAYSLMQCLQKSLYLPKPIYTILLIHHMCKINEFNLSINEEGTSGAQCVGEQY